MQVEQERALAVGVLSRIMNLTDVETSQLARGLLLTNTSSLAGQSPAVTSAAGLDERDADEQGAQFTCFTGTKVQILTQLWRRPDDASTKLCERLYQVNPKFTCFTGTKSGIYLLYWYKTTNSDANAPGRRPRMRCTTGRSKRICTRRVSLTRALLEL